MISWMQSLSDTTRTRLLRVLDGQELTVVELCAVLQMPQSTVSRHLRTLADDGWVTSRRDGPSNLYSLKAHEPSRQRLWDLVREETAGELYAAQDSSRLQEVLSRRSSRSQAFFSSAADRWDGLRKDLFGSRLDAWAAAALVPADWTVLDLGCGTGILLQSLAACASSVIGVDSSDAMLEAARRRLRGSANVQLLHADAEELPLADAAVNAVVMSILLSYTQQPEAVIAEAARVTRPGGRLILIDLAPHERVEFRTEFNHAWLGFEPQRVEAWLAESGWRCDRVAPLPPQPEASGPNLFLCMATRLGAERESL